MNKINSGLPGRTETKSTSEQMIDYSPKEYTLSQSLLIGLKFFLIVGIILGVLWGIELFIY